MNSEQLFYSSATVAVSAYLCCWVYPVIAKRFSLFALVNARSAHLEPTPTGAGVVFSFFSLAFIASVLRYENKSTQADISILFVLFFSIIASLTKITTYLLTIAFLFYYVIFFYDIKSFFTKKIFKYRVSIFFYNNLFYNWRKS